MVNQKQAVTNAVLTVFPDFQLGGETSLAEILTDTAKKEIKSIIVNGFMSGKIEMSEEGKAKYFSNQSELSKYVVGLINNWVRKNPEFNGGNGYTVKNPGSRKGAGDETLKALRQLLKVTTDAQVKSEIESAISERLNDIKPKVEINLAALPEHLRYLVG
jgi:hypothetical protein